MRDILLFFLVLVFRKYFFFFEGEYGYVRYIVKVMIEKLKRFIYVIKIVFFVIGLLDLNIIL